MNLTDLWAGNDYAYYDMRGRGEIYRPHARRVRIIRAYQKRQAGNERLSGFAEVFYLNDDGTNMTTFNGAERTGEIRARDIAMRWDEYVDERNHREAEKERIQQEIEERRIHENNARTALLDKMVEKLGIPREVVTSIDNSTIRINRSMLEGHLGVSETNGGQ